MDIINDHMFALKRKLNFTFKTVGLKLSSMDIGKQVFIVEIFLLSWKVVL